MRTIDAQNERRRISALLRSSLLVSWARQLVRAAKAFHVLMTVSGFNEIEPMP
jgi:hypothetical protein